jgi:hypothetical protein
MARLCKRSAVPQGCRNIDVCQLDISVKELDTLTKECQLLLGIFFSERHSRIDFTVDFLFVRVNLLYFSDQFPHISC